MPMPIIRMYILNTSLKQKTRYHIIYMTNEK